MVDRTPEPSLNCWVAFDGLMTGKVGDWIVSLQNYTVGVNVHLGLPNRLGGFFCQDDHAFVFCDFSRISEQASGQAGRIDENGNRNGCDETRNKRDGMRLHNWTVLLSGLAHNRISWRLPLSNMQGSGANLKGSASGDRRTIGAQRLFKSRLT